MGVWASGLECDRVFWTRFSPHMGFGVCLLTSHISVLFWWGPGLALEDTLSGGPRVADQGASTSLAHFPRHTHQGPDCEGSPRDNRRHC